MTYAKAFLGLALSFGAIDILWYKDSIAHGSALACVAALALVLVLLGWNSIRNLLIK